MEYLYKYKRLFIIGLVVVSLALMAFTGRQNYEQGFIRSGIGFVITSGQGFFASIGDWFSARWESMRNSNALQAENQMLRAENDRLQALLDSQLHLENENHAMAELLDLQRHYADFSTVGANIIAHDPSNWTANFTIDRGSRDGVSADMAVIAVGGLTGRVSSAGFNYSIVTPLIQDGAAVTAMGLRTGETGVVTGDVNLASRGLLRMNHIETDANLSPGDVVMTSPMSTIFPPGIRIGRIVEMGQASGGLRYAIVEPEVDFGRISAVLVITDTFEFEME